MQPLIDYAIIYDKDSGEILSTFTGPAGSAPHQRVPDNGILLVMPFGAFFALPRDLNPLKETLCSQVDLAAGNFRKTFVTDIPGQQTVYQAKEQEARAWTVKKDKKNFPYLTAEAEATGTPIADLVTKVIEQADKWNKINPIIEATRVSVRAKIREASNIARMVEVAKVDWDSVAS